MTPAINISRRHVFAAGGSAAAAVALAACSSAADTGTNSTSTATGSDSSQAAVELAKLADIPVGGGIAATLDGEPILLAQPTKGTVIAFSAICTHRGCTVKPAASEFDCPCHQSRFDLTTGAVLGGPAPRALDNVTVRLEGDAVMAG